MQIFYNNFLHKKGAPSETPLKPNKTKYEKNYLS